MELCDRSDWNNESNKDICLGIGRYAPKQCILLSIPYIYFEVSVIWNKIEFFFRRCLLGTKGEKVISPCHSSENFDSNLYFWTPLLSTSLWQLEAHYKPLD